ncbi:MAG TPA: phosphate ABC transporter permease [Candidatus Sericytochromatia bacterium]|jgi:hypothetical protein
MLVPITRQKFEQLIPLLATGPQYAYFWGKFSNLLKRLLISVLAVVGALILKAFGSWLDGIGLLIGIIGALYWLWGPVFWATLRNIEIRRYQYSGFWRGRVLDVFVTEELIGTEESVNNRGELVIAENRERRLNLEVGDETGFTSQFQVPLRRLHKGISRGQVAEMLLLSYQPDLESIAKTTDIYIPSLNLWVSDYPYLQRDTFVQVSRQLGKSGDGSPTKRGVNPKRRRR